MGKKLHLNNNNPEELKDKTITCHHLFTLMTRRSVALTHNKWTRCVARVNLHVEEGSRCCWCTPVNFPPRIHAEFPAVRLRISRIPPALDRHNKQTCCCWAAGKQRCNRRCVYQPHIKQWRNVTKTLWGKASASTGVLMLPHLTNN